MKTIGLTFALLLGMSSALWPQTPAAHRIVEFDVPGAGQGPGQGPIGRNVADDGSILGSYLDSKSVQHGFLRSPDGNSIVTFDPPGSVATYPEGFNSAHAVVGWYVDSESKMHGFLRSPASKFTRLDAPGAGRQPNQGTMIAGINATNNILGYYLDSSNAYHGFLTTPAGNYTETDAPDAGTGPFQGTQPACVTDGGVIVGSYVDLFNQSHGFLRAPDGGFTEFDPAGSFATYVSCVNSQETIAGIYLSDSSSTGYGFLRTPDGHVTSFGKTWSSFSVGGINAAGSVTGWFYDTQLVAYGYDRAADGTISSISAPDADIAVNHGTYPFSNNASGEITGTYSDSIGAYHGFLRY